LPSLLNVDETLLTPVIVGEIRGVCEKPLRMERGKMARNILAFPPKKLIIKEKGGFA
jgi:hypothetical protein